MSEDKDLEKLKAKRLEEMQRNISLQQKQEEQKKSNETQQKKSTTREIVVKTLGHRGLEVLKNAEYQFPNETKMLIEKLAELITMGEINEILDGGKLLTLFRAIGINVRMETKINVEHDGKFVSLSEKLGSKLSDTNQDDK